MDYKELTGREIKVLDKGFVRLVDYMGDDQRVVQAARVSYGQGSKGEAADKGLINYLMRNRHTSPFEQVNFTFHVKMPIFVARQIVRHRTARLNEISGRYTEMKDEFYVPEVGRMQKQAVKNKQGSSSELVDNAQEIQGFMRAEQESLYAGYEDYLQADMAKELARINLPLSLYTEWYWTIDLHNLFHFLGLRMDPHAQWEVQEYARAKYELIKPIVPWSCEAFEEHVINGKRLSAREWSFVRSFLSDDHDAQGFMQAAEQHFGQGTELREFLGKLKV